MNFKAMSKDVYVLPEPAAPPANVIVAALFKNISCFLEAGAIVICPDILSLLFFVYNL
jgi:hypothetical protein